MFIMIILEISLRTDLKVVRSSSGALDVTAAAAGLHDSVFWPCLAVKSLLKVVMPSKGTLDGLYASLGLHSFMEIGCLMKSCLWMEEQVLIYMNQSYSRSKKNEITLVLFHL